MKRDISKVIDKLKADRRVQRLFTMFDELPLYKLPIKQLKEEIETIHSARSVRFLNQHDPRFIEKIIDASLDDTAKRSRLVEITVQCFKSGNSMNEALDKMRRYLISTYADDIYFARTKEERSNIVDMVLAPLARFVAHTQAISKMADQVIADIDKAGYSLKLIVEAYKIHYGRKEQSI